MSMGQVCFKLPKIYNYTILNQIFILFSLKNTVFTVFSCIIQNPVVSVWYYHMPFFSNVEAQVWCHIRFISENNITIRLGEPITKLLPKGFFLLYLWKVSANLWCHIKLISGNHITITKWNRSNCRRTTWTKHQHKESACVGCQF